MWNVVNLLESSSSFTRRNPSLASRTVNTCALASLEVTSWMVGRQSFGILTCLFNSLGSRQTGSWPLRFFTYTALLCAVYVASVAFLLHFMKFLLEIVSQCDGYGSMLILFRYCSFCEGHTTITNALPAELRRNVGRPFYEITHEKCEIIISGRLSWGFKPQIYRCCC